MAAIGLLFLIVFVGGFGLWLFALVDALGRDDRAYAAAGQTKLVWVLVILLANILGALIYLAVARPRLTHPTFR